jgi:hypothetical protein
MKIPDTHTCPNRKKAALRKGCPLIVKGLANAEAKNRSPF